MIAILARIMYGDISKPSENVLDMTRILKIIHRDVYWQYSWEQWVDFCW